MVIRQLLGCDHGPDIYTTDTGKWYRSGLYFGELVVKHLLAYLCLHCRGRGHQLKQREAEPRGDLDAKLWSLDFSLEGTGSCWNYKLYDSICYRKTPQVAVWWVDWSGLHRGMGYQ